MGLHRILDAPKGVAAAWQSTLANIRIEEFISCMTKAFSNAQSVEQLNTLGEQAYKEYYSFAMALNELKVNHIVSFPTRDNWIDYLTFSSNYLMWGIQVQSAYATKFESFYDGVSKEGKNELISLSTVLGLDDLHVKCKHMCLNAGIELWNNTHKRYSTNDKTDYMFETSINDGTIAIQMINYCIPSDTSKVSDDEKVLVVRACKTLIPILTEFKTFKGQYKYIATSSKQKYSSDIQRFREIIRTCDPSYEVSSSLPSTRYIGMQAVSSDVCNEIELLMSKGEKLKAVNVVRNATGLGLADAKQFVENHKEGDWEPFDLGKQTSGSSGCYIATAVYGSYDCPQVWVLRRYRDKTLASTWYGRAFIRTYYTISPTLVKWFGKTEWFKNLWKPKLDRMVERLNREGVADTPYSDEKW